MPTVRFFTHLAPHLAQRITQHAPSDYQVSVHPTSTAETEKIALVRDADFLVLFPGVIAESVLKATSHLKLIQLVSAGYERIDIDLCREVGIPVANNGGTNSIDVAEHTIALILGFYRHMIAQDHNVRTQQWGQISTGESTYTVNGKTIGIVGFGNIGRRVSQLFVAFGADVLYYDKYPPPLETDQALGVTRSSIDDLLRASDIVTCHLPLSADTRHFVGKRELSLMKPTALLVNTCRGSVIDEVALTETLTEGRILGAALDVLEQEPPDPDNPILKLDNVLFTPHSAGVTYDTWARRGAFVFENLQRVWRGESALALVGEF